MKNIAYISALALAAMLAACSGDSDEGAQTGGANAVRINATAGAAAQTRSNPTGTAEEQTTFNSGDVITISDGKSTASYEYDGSTWTSSDWLTWHSEPETFQAYYPGGISGNGYTQGTIQQDQSTEENLAKSDYMTCETTAATIPNDRTLSLTMERKAALVAVSGITYGNEFDGCSPAISAITITSPSLAIPSDGTAAAITPYKDETSGNYYAIVSPSSALGTEAFISLTVSYTESGESKTKTLTVEGIPAHAAGNSYTYSLKIGKDKAEIGGVTVSDWTTGTITGGKAKLVYKFNVSITDEPKYVKFTSGNLQYDITNSKYQLAENQWDYIGGESYTIENDYIISPNVIDLFGWGSAKGATYASTSKSDFSTTFTDWGTQAAKDLGLDYELRTLTKNEWAGLFTRTNQPSCLVTLRVDDNKSYHGVVVFPCGVSIEEALTYISGDNKSIYEGTCDTNTMTAEALEKSGAIFLPAAGTRKGSTISNVGSYGYYWANYGLASYYKANCWYFSNTSMKNYQSYDICYGCSVRLVRDVE